MSEGDEQEAHDHAAQVRAQDLAALRLAQARAHDQVHEVANLLAIYQAEMDLVIDRAREAIGRARVLLEDYYAKYPDEMPPTFPLSEIEP